LCFEVAIHISQVAYQSCENMVYTEWSRRNCTKFNALSFCNRLQ